MRAIVQRVTKASVTVGDELVSSIGKGLCVLVGISRDDTAKDMEYIVRKILNLRVFEDDQEKRWSKSVMDKQYEVLCVSQFTLYSILKGNKPDFHSSMGGDESKLFYEKFYKSMQDTYSPGKLKDGQFGAHMQVHIQNDGPVTITLESPKDLPPLKERKQVNQKKVKGNKNSSSSLATNESSASLTSNPSEASLDSAASTDKDLADATEKLKTDS